MFYCIMFGVKWYILKFLWYDTCSESMGSEDQSGLRALNQSYEWIEKVMYYNCGLRVVNQSNKFVDKGHHILACIRIVVCVLWIRSYEWLRRLSYFSMYYKLWIKLYEWLRRLSYFGMYYKCALCIVNQILWMDWEGHL